MRVADNIHELCRAALQQNTILGVSYLDCPSSAEYDILSAEEETEETPEQLGMRLHLMSDDMSDHPAVVALPLGPRARGRSPPATASVIDRPLGFFSL